MTSTQVNEYKQWFQAYTQQYQTNAPHCPYQMKRDHTERVCHNISELCKSLKLSDNDSHIAYVIAIFHDLGRFEQYKQYKTLHDNQSVNHAKLSIWELQRNHVLSNCDPIEKRFIMKGIAYHNVPNVPQNLDPQSKLLIQLIRDADKLDIYKVLTDYYLERDKSPNKIIELNLPNSPGFSSAILSQLLHHKNANYHDLKNLNDFKLIQIGWVFDLNFSYSIQQVKQNQYIEKIAQTLPQTEEIQSYLNYVQSYRL